MDEYKIEIENIIGNGIMPFCELKCRVLKCSEGRYMPQNIKDEQLIEITEIFWRDSGRLVCENGFGIDFRIID